jgi:hypothetical protein
MGDFGKSASTGFGGGLQVQRPENGWLI